MSLLIGKPEAARMLSMSVRAFERHVLPFVPRVYAGQRVLFDPVDLERWRDDRKTMAGPDGIWRGEAA